MALREWGKFWEHAVFNFMRHAREHAEAHQRDGDGGREARQLVTADGPEAHRAATADT